MKRWLQIASVLILLPFIGKILFLETGLLAQSMYQLSMICHCNHGTKNEIHKEENSPPSQRIVCLLTRESGPHVCSCAKKKSATKILQSQSMNPNFATENKYNPIITYEALIIAFHSDPHLLNGFAKLPYKPPRQIHS